MNWPIYPVNPSSAARDVSPQGELRVPRHRPTHKQVLAISNHAQFIVPSRRMHRITCTVEQLFRMDAHAVIDRINSMARAYTEARRES